MVDESMMAKSQMEDSKAVDIEDGEGGARGRRTLEDGAMQDITDLKNEDFIYVY